MADVKRSSLLKKILIGAAVAAAGAAITYVAEQIPGLDIPPEYLPAVTAVASVAANAIRKYGPAIVDFLAGLGRK